MFKALKAFFKDEEGQGMVEYGLIIALIAIVVIGALTSLGNSTNSIFGEAGTALGGTASGEQAAA